MAELADEILNGEICVLCLTPFLIVEEVRRIKQTNERVGVMGYAHGYPIACEKCYREGCGYPKAHKDAKML